MSGIDLRWGNSTMMYKKAGEIKCQPALILPGTSIAILLVFCGHCLYKNSNFSDHLVNTWMHKRGFQDHSIILMMKKVPK